MKIETKFDMYEKVAIKAMDNFPATVTEIKIDGKNIFFHVEYFLNCEIKGVNLCEWELEHITE